MQTVTVSYANKNFPNLLRAIARGESIRIVSCGNPVATLVPAETGTKDQSNKGSSGDRQENKTRTARRNFAG
jgi:prevent-host-death family protein